MHAFHSEEVLVKRRVERLPMTRSIGAWPAGWNNRDQQANNRIDRRTPMKKLFLAVALVVAFAAPAMAEQFPNLYATNADAGGH